MSTSSSYHASTAVGTDELQGDNKSVTSTDDGIVHGELENQDEVKRLSLHSFHLWSLGISIVIGGHYIGWNEVLQSGFGSALIATALISSAYVCLVCCMAEVSSAIPFGGGSYAIARVTLGFFPGYMVACMEACQNIIFVATSAVMFGEIATIFTTLPHRYEPIYWVFFYVSSLALQICGGRTFWYMIVIMAIVSIGLLVVYIFGTIPDFDFNENALFHREHATGRWFRDGGSEFMRVLPLPCWFYLGVENINLACKDVPNPRAQVPRGYLSCIATLVVMTFAVLFCCSSVAPGIAQLMYEVDPLHIQFQEMFHATHTAANMIVIPSIYAMCSGFMYCYGKQLKAMAKSGLINPYFAQNHGYKTPVKTLLVGSFVSFLVALADQFSHDLTDRHLFVLCTLCAFVAYASQFASFIIFRYKFATIKREYESPLGIAGAIYGALVFTVAFIGAVGFQNDFVAITIFAVLMVVVVAYYFYAAMDRQSFSEEEKQVMFRAYLMKSNDDRNRRLKKGKAAQVGCAAHTAHAHANSPTPDKYKPVSTLTHSASLSETQRSAQTDKDTFKVTAFDFSASPRELSPRSAGISPRGAGINVKLLVDTGSGRIAMTGEVAPEELYCNTALQGVLQDNEDVEMMGESLDLDNGVEIVNMTQSALLDDTSIDRNHLLRQRDEESAEFTNIERV